MAIDFRFQTVLMLLVVCFLPEMVVSDKYASFTKLPLPQNVSGPESLAFDSNGGGPYTGTADGRIFKYQGPVDGFVEFATTSPHRNKKLCDGQSGINLRPMCGRPLGLATNYMNGDLYIVDSSFGLLVVGPNGGLAKQLAFDVDGKPFSNANAVAVDPLTGIVYFSDTGPIFRRRNITQILLSGDKNGKLLKYDPRTKKVRVLLTGLSGPTGVAVSKDGTFVQVTEFIAKRIQRFWINGPKSNTSDILRNFKGCPDNIRRTVCGDFWVAVNVIDLKTQRALPIGQKINPFGKVLKTRSFDSEYPNASVSEVHENDGGLYIGSGHSSFVGVYQI